MQACCTNTTPIDWSSCQDCYGSLTKEHSKSKEDKYRFYEMYIACPYYNYMVVKYPPTSSYDEIDVKVS